MALAAKLRRAPLRIATGAYILNSGIGKISADEGTAGYLHGAATTAYPVIKKVPPTTFAKVLAFSEVGVGAALLLPIVPAGLAGLALLGFSGALIGMYVRTPGVHDSYLRPTADGIALAKDVWMLGTGAALVIDAALAESPVTRTEV
jgi:uncharacterized membrane protein YphA (DoxX/SURF4 family)